MPTRTEPEISLHQIEADGELSDTETSILRILKRVLDFGSDSNHNGTATDPASKICDLLPCNLQDSDVVEGFIWSLWTLLIRVACVVPHDHVGQQMLVDVVSSLHDRDVGMVKIWGREQSLWKDLPLIGPCMREAWFDPTSEEEPSTDDDDDDDDDDTNEARQEWHNQNSFAGRLLGAGLASWTVMGLWQLRAALEEENIHDTTSTGSPTSTSTPTCVRAFRVAVACEWIQHAGACLLRECRAGTGTALTKAEATSHRVGSLFAGDPEFCMRRWEFWKRRLGEFGAIDSGEVDDDYGVRGVARAAVARMEACELGYTVEDASSNYGYLT